MVDEEVRIHIRAAPGVVWGLVSDVTNMGQWSPICRRCEWIDGAIRPAVGARFRGHSRRYVFRWSRECVVTASEPGRTFAFTTFFKGRESVHWLYKFEASESGTEVIESYDKRLEPLWVRAIEFFGPVRALAKRDIRRGMEQTLLRVKLKAEAMEEGSDSRQRVSRA